MPSWRDTFAQSREDSFTNTHPLNNLHPPRELLSLGCVKWSEFFISEVAEILSGRDIYDDERLPGLTPYIGASSLNNGITHFISNTNETKESDCISVNRNGSVGYAFYHPYEALYSNDCRKLRPRVRDKYISLFMARQITAQRGKYSYGYKMGTARLMRQKILLPADDSGQPHWEFMRDFMRTIEAQKLSSVINHFTQKRRA
ncbi:MAG: restriction endonuclease subunit S [Synergistaceae bacterium]|nr:restriction endonuclease subunit S [Synergistaceae bacterium]